MCLGLTIAVSSRGERMRASGLLDCVVRQGEPLHSGPGAIGHFLHAGKARDDRRERLDGCVSHDVIGDAVAFATHLHLVNDLIH